MYSLQSCYIKSKTVRLVTFLKDKDSICPAWAVVVLYTFPTIFLEEKSAGIEI
jgi:hypothetical protein